MSQAIRRMEKFGFRSHLLFDLTAINAIVFCAATVPSRVAAQPLNDSCWSATFIGSTPFSDRVYTGDATASSTDPTPMCGRGSSLKSVFYRLTVTSPEGAMVTANTFGSDYDTVLSVYTGHCGGLIPVPRACDDDAFTSQKAMAGQSRQSQVGFYASPGTTYYLMATAYDGHGGTLVLNVDDPPGGVSLESCALDPNLGSHDGMLFLIVGALALVGARRVA